MKNTKLVCIISAVVFVLIALSVVLLRNNSPYAFSDLKIDEYEIVGKMQNKSNKDCDLLSVEYVLKSGGIEEEGSFLLSDITEKKVYSFRELAYDMEKYSDDKYEIKIKSAKCMD